MSINTGDTLGLYGRNGCGKSTLLKLLFSTMVADSLKLKIDIKIISPESAGQKQLFAYITQHPFLSMNVRVRDIIPMYYDGQEQDKIFYDKYVASFNARKVNELSLGQGRYFEVVLVGNLSAPFLVIDEPFSMIEPLHKER